MRCTISFLYVSDVFLSPQIFIGSDWTILTIFLTVKLCFVMLEYVSVKY